MIDFYTSDTANGQKVALMLEETGLAYRRHDVDLVGGAHLEAAFLAVHPLGKIPAIVDADGPGGTPLALGQSLTIVLYLAEKSGRLLPADPRERALALQYMALVASDIGAAFSGLFNCGLLLEMTGRPAVRETVAYFTDQAHRGLAVLDRRLSESAYLAGDAFTVADILAYPIAVSSVRLLEPEPLAAYPAIARWARVIALRPAARTVFTKL
ncbi:glutathione S-transferase family protein [Sphingomonas sp. UYP23]